MYWLIALCVAALFAFIPVGVSCIYGSQGGSLTIKIGPCSIPILPRKKSTPTKKAQKAEKADISSEPVKASVKKQGGSIEQFSPFLRIVLDLLSDVRRKIRVDLLILKVVLAGDDPCDLALRYGKACASVANFMPHIENLFTVKKRDVDVECDFTADKTRIYARLDVSITVGRIVGLGVRYGLRLLRQYFKMNNQRKGGAEI